MAGAVPEEGRSGAVPEAGAVPETLCHRHASSPVVWPRLSGEARKPTSIWG